MLFRSYHSSLGTTNTERPPFQVFNPPEHFSHEIKKNIDSQPFNGRLTKKNFDNDEQINLMMDVISDQIKGLSLTSTKKDIVKYITITDSFIPKFWSSWVYCRVDYNIGTGGDASDNHVNDALNYILKTLNKKSYWLEVY
mgnify:CR=1 FL=1